MTLERDDLYQRMTAVLDGGDERKLTETLSHARAADIAEVFELIDDEQRSKILFALPPHTAAEVVVMVDEAVRGDIVEELDTESLTEIVSELPPDDAADMLSELPPDEVEEILDHMEAEQSDKIGDLLGYDEETAGGIMTPDVVAVPARKTVADAVEYVREATQEEDLHEIYIVDDDRRLLGTVPLRRLVTNPPTTQLESICDRDSVTVLALDDQETVVQIIRKYDVMSAAVVDDQGRLLGTVTHDDLLDVAEEEAAEDLYRMAGTDPAELETGSVFRAARIRLTWLLPCMLGMLVTAAVLAVSETKFEPALFIALAFFVPMIGAMGGNSGIQTSTVIVRGFATGELASTKFLRSLAREGRIAAIMSVACGLAAWCSVTMVLPVYTAFVPEASWVGTNGRLPLAVGIAMTLAILMAGFLGIALPYTFRRLGVDPAIASGPLVTTTNDIVSVAIYMSLAMMIAR